LSCANRRDRRDSSCRVHIRLRTIGSWTGAPRSTYLPTTGAIPLRPALRSLLGVTPPIHPQHQSAVLRLPVCVRDKISSGSRAHRKLYGAPSSIRVSRMPCYGAHGPVPEKATGHQPCVVGMVPTAFQPYLACDLTQR
jgi:hypothetical protein